VPQQWNHLQNNHGPPPPYRCQTVRSPLKFIKGEFRESDYESDYECRIQPIWRPRESAAAVDGPVYKPVRPGFRTLTATGRTDIGPAPSYRTYQSPSAAPSRDPEPAFELKPGSPPEIGFAPSPVATGSAAGRNEPDDGASVTSTTTRYRSDGGGDVASVERNAAEAKRLQRVDEMRKRFEHKSIVPGAGEADGESAAVSASFTSAGTQAGI